VAVVVLFLGVVVVGMRGQMAHAGGPDDTNVQQYLDIYLPPPTATEAEPPQVKKVFKSKKRKSLKVVPKTTKRKR
jgi:hypothetical protein